MRIHAVDAGEGDCLLLESDDQFALIDGGIKGTYERRLAPYLLDTVGRGGTLNAVIVSHVDTDHITGVLDLFADLERARADGEADTFVVPDLWHNSFSRTMDTPNGELLVNLRMMMGQAGRANVAAAHGSIAFLGISHGYLLERLATKLRIPINHFFGGRPIVQDDAAGQLWTLGATQFAIAGPTQANLKALQDEWIRWIEDNVDGFAVGDLQTMANADKSVPNLSSVVMHGTTPHGDVLLTGDARGDHILQGLEQSGLLTPGGTHAYRLIKVQHHGSDRNVARSFFERLSADIYLISANGKHGNPDVEVLEMIVDTAPAQGRSPLLVFTNEAPSLDKLRASRPPQTHGYRLEVRKPADSAIVVDLETGAVA